MKRFIITMALIAIAACSALSVQAQIPHPSTLPRVIKSGPYPTGHIQGIAVDAENKYIYLSYTTMLVKADLQGNVVGSVKGLLGHLGCLDFNVEDGKVYGSLEYKNDIIGQHIMQREKSSLKINNAFYVAIFDVDRITRMDMDAEKDGVMTTVHLGRVLDDYLSSVEVEGKSHEHRLGCSGIDGMSFGPKFGKKGGKQYLTVAYGIYRDLERSDNDYQVLQQYDIKDWAKYARPVSQADTHHEGPAKPDGEYFVYTGNTHWGVQNLEYDPHTCLWFMAVYRGKKPNFPNYSLFAADGTAKVSKQPLKGVPYIAKGNVVALAEKGLSDPKSGVRGWNFGVGSTGLCSLGDGFFYISHNFKIKEGQGSTIYLYKYTGDPKEPFVKVK